MEKQSPTPDKIRLYQYAVIDGIRNGSLLPSSLLRILTEEQDEELKTAMISAYEETASPGYKEKVEKVRDALLVLQEFNKSDSLA